MSKYHTITILLKKFVFIKIITLVLDHSCTWKSSQYSVHFWLVSLLWIWPKPAEKQKRNSNQNKTDNKKTKLLSNQDSLKSFVFGREKNQNASLWRYCHLVHFFYNIILKDGKIARKTKGVSCLDLCIISFSHSILRYGKYFLKNSRILFIENIYCQFYIYGEHWLWFSHTS